MEEIGIPELTSEEVGELCELADKSGRQYVLSRIPSSRISTFNVTVEVDGVKPITVNVDVEITLSPLVKNYDVEKLVDEATEYAFLSVERYLRKLACKSVK